MSDRAVNVPIALRPVRLLGLAGAVGLAVAACGDGRRPAAPPPPEPAAPPRTPLADAVLDRVAILTAVDAAASGAAAGVAPTENDPLANRRFRMRVAFGCLGAEPAPLAGADAGSPHWSRAPDGTSIRLRFTPADWTAGDPTGPAVDGFERVGGLWINQPWMRSEGCPAPGLPALDAFDLPARPNVGLALLRAEGASRLGRADDRAFTFTIRGQGEAPAPDPARGYRLVLEGRLTPWADGRVIRCRVQRADTRPTCAAGVALDRLAYEDGVTGAILSEWRPL